MSTTSPLTSPHFWQVDNTPPSIIIAKNQIVKIMNQNFTVISSNANSTGGFVTKIARETSVDTGVFGTKVKRETFYVSGSKQLQEKSEIPVNMDLFVVREYPFVEADGSLPKGEDGKEIHDGNFNPLMLKWLHLK